MNQATISGRNPQPSRKKSDVFRRGRVDGKVWANRRATFKELDRFADLDIHIRHDWGTWANHERGIFSLPQMMGSVPEGDARASEEFWREVIGPEWGHMVGNREFVEGFVEAVLEVYSRVAVQLGHA